MSNKLGGDTDPFMEKTFEGLLMAAEGSQSNVVSGASRIIDALMGKGDAKPLPHNLMLDLASAPEAIPAVEWTDMIPSSVGDPEDWLMHVTGDLGEYYSAKFSDEKPSATFNSGFYAGVLAVKKGLVDAELFHHDSELNQEPIDDRDPAA